MKGKIVTIKTTGEITEVDVSTASILPLLREAVGGHIEQVPFFDTYEYDNKTVSCVAFCNEEGKLHLLDMNEIATIYWYRSAGRSLNDILVGDIAVVFGDDEFMTEL